MKKSYLLCLFVFLTLVASAGRLSDGAKMSLLTATPGQELYSAFGHSALWVYDPEMGIDEVYNYGTFDFQASNFYLNFAVGKLNYKLTVTTLNDFLFVYYIEGRGIEEQELNLSFEEMQVVYDFLTWNRQPGNEYYLYDFFFDNCATRIRDLIDNLLQINWDDGLAVTERQTFRQLLGRYLYPNPWAGFGINLVLGLPSDRVATLWEEMYLPDYMFQAFANARHFDGRPLVSETRILLPQTNPPKNTAFIQPIWASWLILILGVLSLFWLRLTRIFDKLFFSALGFAGLVLFFLWFISDHSATNSNLNLLWAIPFHVYFIFRAYLLFPIGIPRYYFKVVFILNVILLASWPIFPQTFHSAFFPLILLSAIKSFPYGFGDVWKKVPLFEKHLLR